MRSNLSRRRLGKILLFLLSVCLFVVAVILMKEGAAELAPLLRGRLRLESPLGSLGFGWLAAYLIMSGSPVAAVALTFLDVGVLTARAAFTMVTGSRLGAGFVVLFLGFLYVLRGRDRASSLSMGLLALAITGSTHLLALIPGLAILEVKAIHGLLSWLHAARFWPGEAGPFALLAGAVGAAPAWSRFPAGLALIMVSFALFDRCLPQVSLRTSHVGQISRLVYRPWVMFLLGAGVTLISMSISISLGLLVPLGDRGLVRRENVIPYIMGANITTFVDTLFIAALLDNGAAVAVVTAEILSMGGVSLAILGLVYGRYQYGMLAFTDWATASSRRLGLVVATLLATPLLLFLWG